MPLGLALHLCESGTNEDCFGKCTSGPGDDPFTRESFQLQNIGGNWQVQSQILPIISNECKALFNVSPIPGTHIIKKKFSSCQSCCLGSFSIKKANSDPEQNAVILRSCGVKDTNSRPLIINRRDSSQGSRVVSPALIRGSVRPSPDRQLGP